MRTTLTHNESLKRFSAQPIGRAKLYLLDYCNTKSDLPHKLILNDYLAKASDLSIRTFAAGVEAFQPNRSDFEYLLNQKHTNA